MFNISVFLCYLLVLCLKFIYNKQKQGCDYMIKACEICNKEFETDSASRIYCYQRKELEGDR